MVVVVTEFQEYLLQMPDIHGDDVTKLAITNQTRRRLLFWTHYFLKETGTRAGRDGRPLDQNAPQEKRRHSTKLGGTRAAPPLPQM